MQRGSTAVLVDAAFLLKRYRTHVLAEPTGHEPEVTPRAMADFVCEMAREHVARGGGRRELHRLFVYDSRRRRPRR